MILNRRARRALKPKGVRVAGRDAVSIQKEYVELCAKLGEVTLRLDGVKKAIEGLNGDRAKLTEALGKLQSEYEAHMRSEQEKAKQVGDKLNEVPNSNDSAPTSPDSVQDASGTPAIQQVG